MQEKWQKKKSWDFSFCRQHHKAKNQVLETQLSAVLPHALVQQWVQKQWFEEIMLPHVASWALIWASVLSSSGLLVRQLIPSGFKPAKFGGWSSQKTLFQGQPKGAFSSRDSFFFPPFLFTGCSVPDRQLQSSLEDMHHGGQPGVNSNNCASCLSNMGFPVWSQLSAFTVLAADNYQTLEQVTSPKRHFSSLYFSPSLATVF